MILWKATLTHWTVAGSQFHDDLLTLLSWPFQDEMGTFAFPNNREANRRKSCFTKLWNFSCNLSALKHLKLILQTPGPLFLKRCLKKLLYVKKCLCQAMGSVKAIWNVLQMNRKHLWKININCQDPASHFVADLNASAVTCTVRCWHYNYSLILEEWIITIANTLISHTHNYAHSLRKDSNIKIPSLNRILSSLTDLQNERGLNWMRRKGTVLINAIANALEGKP